jgi:hypothetical protein
MEPPHAKPLFYPRTNRRDTTALLLKPAAVFTTPYGCPTFAPAYVGLKRWGEAPINALSFPLIQALTFLRPNDSVLVISTKRSTQPGNAFGPRNDCRSLQYAPAQLRSG